jgi:hypothetical protein
MSEDPDDDFWADMAQLNSPISREVTDLRSISKENNENNLIKKETVSGTLAVDTAHLPESPVCPLKKRPVRYKEVSPSVASGGEISTQQEDWDEKNKESESHEDIEEADIIKFPSPRPPTGPKRSSSSSNHTSPSSHQSDFCQQSEPNNGREGLFVDDFDNEEDNRHNTNHNSSNNNQNVAVVEECTTAFDDFDDDNGRDIVNTYEADAVDLSAITDAINEVMSIETTAIGGVDDDGSNGDVVNYRVFNPLPQVGFVPDSAGMKKKKCVKVSVSGSNTSKGYKHSSFAKDISCSNLRCLKCNFSVLIFNECTWEDSVDYMFFRNNVPNEIKLSKKLILKTDSCAYCCQCSWTHTYEDVDLKQIGHIQWVCGSHLES